jgi:predicted DNA-binding protein
MAKPTRRSATVPTHRTVKTSVLLGVEVHAKLAALAALRGVPMTTIMAEAIADAVSSMVVFDRAARTTKPVDSPVQERESADAA